MSSKTTVGLIGGVVSLLLLGAGCASFSLNPGDQASTTSSRMFAGLDAKAAAEKIQFAQGDHVELRQTFLGLGAFLSSLTQSTVGERLITIQRFAPQQSADITWSVAVDRETEASKRARAAYDKDLREHPRAIGEPTPVPPVPVTEHMTASGTLLGIDLLKSHKLFPAAYWPEANSSVHQEKSVLWLADDAFQELVKTRKTSLSFGLFDETASDALKRVRDIQDLIARLQRQAIDEQKRTDPFLLQADPDFINWTLKVNGVPVTVSAIKAHNWFGEVVVLNNPKNPLILKMTINPFFAGAGEAATQGFEGLKNIFGYEVVRVTVPEM